MTSQFEELLHELGKIFHLELHIDRHHACSIAIQGQLTIQLQPDIAQQNLFLFAKLTEIPPGKFRENVLKETLKANALTDPRVGLFGYLAATNQLILFQKYPMDLLNGDRLAGLFGAFLEFGVLWKKAIESGISAPAKTNQSLPPNPFGLK